MRHVFIFTYIILFQSFTISGQVKEKRKNFFPLWTFQQSNINIHGISVGIASGVHENQGITITNGVKIEIIGLGILSAMIGESPVVENDRALLTLEQTTPSEKINGVSLSLSGCLSDCIINGISLGGMSQINRNVNGMAVSWIMNISQRFNGLQVGFFNDTYSLKGCQCGMMNKGIKTDGLQTGIVNLGKETKGIQIGIFNQSKNLMGIQVGLWNVNQKRKLPLVNWNFRKEYKQEASG